METRTYELLVNTCTLDSAQLQSKPLTRAKSHNHPIIMTLTNRQQLIGDYVDKVLDNMSTKDLVRIVAEQLEENLANYSDEELLTEITEYCPELLEDSDA